MGNHIIAHELDKILSISDAAAALANAVKDPAQADGAKEAQGRLEVWKKNIGSQAMRTFSCQLGLKTAATILEFAERLLVYIPELKERNDKLHDMYASNL